MRRTLRDKMLQHEGCLLTSFHPKLKLNSFSRCAQQHHQWLNALTNCYGAYNKQAKQIGELKYKNTPICQTLSRLFQYTSSTSTISILTIKSSHLLSLKSGLKASKLLKIVSNQTTPWACLSTAFQGSQ